ncbi:MAG: hypothetical protein RRC34_01225 [Lentisphaeria bacterium]|nr:hypothetical protein [Lentisphaeria bacterium]
MTAAMTAGATNQASPLQISGVYPHLCTYTVESGETAKLNECGIGALVPWAGKLWMITYGAHHPEGSTHKLYSIDDNLTMTIHPESVGGTPAGRMIHQESNQLILGHYLVDSDGNVRTISPKTMPARVTAIARHLTDPANKVYVVDMEGMIYEADVHTLEVKKLFHKPVPGWHGKGAYTSQGRLVVSNNGELPVGGGYGDHLLVEDLPESLENAGVLAQWDGTAWEMVERRQFTDVTGPAGIDAVPDDQGPLWSIGWDRRSLRLKILDNGVWHTFLLPKAAHNNDPRHGWFTEWPRIREIGEHGMMMDMHGMFYQFPKTFAAGDTAGIAPISSHLRYIPDFCLWNGHLVIATDEASIMGHKHCGQPQSNLWIGTFDELKKWGPASGYGGPWVKDNVKGGAPSDPFLIAGFDRRVLHLSASPQATFTIEIDPEGRDDWQEHGAFEVGDYAVVTLPGSLKAEWIRMTADKDCEATAYFHGTAATYPESNTRLFAGLAEGSGEGQGGLLYPAQKSRNLQLIAPDGQPCHDVTRDFQFRPTKRDAGLEKMLAVEPEFEIDAASVIVRSRDNRFRLPKGDAAYDQPFAFGWPRAAREVESERNLANIHGSFYEIPRSGFKALPDWERMRPVASHSKQIHDFCTWQGLLVLTGVAPKAEEDGHVFRSDDGVAVWCGAVDDLWQLGKPVGRGGPWKDTAVKAAVPSDPYLMTGYDRKTLELRADKDVTITLEVNVDHQSGWHRYKTFALKAGQTETYRFPPEYSAHWIRFISDTDCTATAWLTYE